MADEVKRGLEGVVAATTKLSFIDGAAGILEYCGYNITDIARFATFEEVMYLLWYGRLPTQKELRAFSQKIRRERTIDSSVIRILQTCAKHIDAMDALRTAVSYLAQCDPDLSNNSAEANIRKGIRLAAKFPTIVAAFYRVKQGKKVIAPMLNLSSGANFLYMLRGTIPNEVEANAMETDFILTAEHELNASTFTTRVTVSTLSDLHSAICSGISTLKGPLHGGARAEVYKMLDKIQKPERAEAFIQRALKQGQKIMGFGHRVYKTYDPRAILFKETALALANFKKDKKWYMIATKVEDVVIKELVEKLGKPIYPNVDFYTGPVYKYLDIPSELTTAIFALGRIAGWVAHALEQYADNRLIRPNALYIGPHNLKYVPLEQR
ncbi:citrate/2-methylcitrate synthase [Candidatus Woesearchaeota archaeon]|nr:citrate/2-methylcitrate synthase [Candidatus Woesearchaeota archaeon]